MHWTNPKTAVPLILLWSLAVHIPGVTSPMRDYHAYRQCQTASMSRNYVRHGMNFLSPEVDTEGTPVRAGTEFPIYSYLLAILFRFFGTQELFGHLLSMVFAAWGAVYLYHFVRPRLGAWIALWSGLVMCTIPVHIYFTRTVQPEPMALWGFLGFLYYGDRWLNRSGRSASWIAAMLLGALAPLLKLPFLYVIAPLWLYLGYERYGMKVLTSTKWIGMMVLILLLTEAWYSYAKTATVILLPLTRQEHLANLAPVLTVRLWRAQFISRIPEIVTTYSGLFFAAVGMYYYRRAKYSPFFFFWALASVLYVALLGEYGLIHRYTLLPLSPLSAVWIACGISVLWEYAKNHPAARVITAILIVGIPVHAAFRIAHWYRLDYDYLSSAHDALATVSQPSDLVLVASHEIPELLYYIDRYGYGIDPATWQSDQVDKLIGKGVRYIFIPIEDNGRRLAEWKAYLMPRGTLIAKDPDYWLYRIAGSTPLSRHG